MAAKPTEIELTYPVTESGQTLTSFHLRRATVADMLVASQASSSDAEREIYMFANLAEVTP